MIFVFGRMIKAETEGGDNHLKVPISIELRVFSTLSRVRMSKSSSEETKVLSKAFTEEATHKEVVFMAEEAEGAEEEDFSREVAYSVFFVEKTRGTLPSIVRSPSRRRRSSKTRKIRVPTKIQGPSRNRLRPRKKDDKWSH